MEGSSPQASLLFPNVRRLAFTKELALQLLTKQTFTQNIYLDSYNSSPKLFDYSRSAKEDRIPLILFYFTIKRKSYEFLSILIETLAEDTLYFYLIYSLVRKFYQ